MDLKVVFQFLNKTLGTYNFKGIYIEPTYWMGAVIVLLIFLLTFTLARIRYLYVHWSLGKSTISFLFYGFLLAIILEGFFILGGRTIFTEILGWKNAPKPIGTLLDLGRNKLAQTLGIYQEIPESKADAASSYQKIIDDYQKLSEKEKDQLKVFICSP